MRPFRPPCRPANAAAGPAGTLPIEQQQEETKRVLPSELSFETLVRFFVALLARKGQPARIVKAVTWCARGVEHRARPAAACVLSMLCHCPIHTYVQVYRQLHREGEP